VEAKIRHHRSESLRHQAKAEAWEEVLAHLRTSGKRPSDAANVGAAPTERSARPPPSPSMNRVDPLTGRRKRVSKYEPILQAWEKAAVNGPLSHDEMARIAAELGRPLERTLLRTVISEQKKLKRTWPVGDRYAWRRPQDTPAAEDS
jgi:hypothetical protein